MFLSVSVLVLESVGLSRTPRLLHSKMGQGKELAEQGKEQKTRTHGSLVLCCDEDIKMSGKGIDFQVRPGDLPE